jgi:hypothetical protein
MILSFDEWSINESTNNRILDTLRKNDAAIMSASRDKYNFRENRARNIELLKKLSNRGYQITDLKGIYIENYGTDDAKKVLEDSYLIVNINKYSKFSDYIINLGEEYDQDCVMLITHGGNRGYLYGTNGATFPGLGNTEELGRLKVASDGEFYSKKSGSLKFTFVRDMNSWLPVVNWIKIR